MLYHAKTALKSKTLQALMMSSRRRLSFICMGPESLSIFTGTESSEFMILAMIIKAEKAQYKNKEF